MQLYLTMPKPGETIREGSVIQWLKKPGEALEEKEPLVELETEKAVFTYESPFRGTLQKILVSEGENVAVGAPLALFEVSDEDGARYRLLGVGLPVSEGSEELGVRSKEKKTKILPSLPLTPHPSQISYSPLIRNLAREHGLSPEELEKIPGSGPGGRLTKEDLLAYVKTKSPQPPFAKGGDVISPPLKKGEEGGFETILLPPIRQRIAQHMKKSHAEIPQAASSVDVDFTEILRFKKDRQAAFQKKHGTSLTPFFFFLFAVRETLKKFPNFNGSYVEEGGKGYLRRFKSVHLGFAAATPQGLLNPILHEAEKLSFSALAAKAAELEKKAKEGKLSVEELTGATFAVNNPGALGGSRCYQIIPSPLVAIAGMNRIQKRPWVAGDSIVPRDVAAIDLSFDHRPLDGADAIQFLESLKKYLENFPFEVVEK